jgi:ribose 5-phosphate isomerase B
MTGKSPKCYFNQARLQGLTLIIPSIIDIEQQDFVMNPKDQIVIGSDHAGFEMKEFIKKELTALGISFTDVGAQTLDARDDYPVFAARVASAVSKNEYRRGIAICGTGLGASMAANRFRKVRAALCITPEMARLSREHNDANVLVLGGRITAPETAAEILRLFLSTPFAGGRHERRKELIDTESEKTA